MEATYKVTCKIQDEQGKRLHPIYIDCNNKEEAEDMAKHYFVVEKGMIYYGTTKIEKL